MTRRRFRSKPLTSGSEILSGILDKLPARVIPEYHFASASGREWRADFALPDMLLLVEYEGLPTAFTKSRHTTRSGYVGDIEKYNYATKQGWRILRYHWDTVNTSDIEADINAVDLLLPRSSTCVFCDARFHQNSVIPFKQYSGKPICLVCEYKKHIGAKHVDEMMKLFSNRSPKRLKDLTKAEQQLGKDLVEFVFVKSGWLWEEKLKIVQDLIGTDWGSFKTQLTEIQTMMDVWTKDWRVRYDR